MDIILNINVIFVKIMNHMKNLWVPIVVNNIQLIIEIFSLHAFYGNAVQILSSQIKINLTKPQ